MCKVCLPVVHERNAVCYHTERDAQLALLAHINTQIFSTSRQPACENSPPLLHITTHLRSLRTLCITPAWGWTIGPSPITYILHVNRECITTDCFIFYAILLFLVLSAIRCNFCSIATNSNGWRIHYEARFLRNPEKIGILEIYKGKYFAHMWCRHWHVENTHTTKMINANKRIWEFNSVKWFPSFTMRFADYSIMQSFFFWCFSMLF